MKSKQTNDYLKNSLEQARKGWTLWKKEMLEDREEDLSDDTIAIENLFGVRFVPVINEPN